MRIIKETLLLRGENITKIKTKAANAREENYLLEGYQYAEKHIVMNATSLSDGIKVSYNTASKIIHAFVKIGIMKLINDQGRNRNCIYHDFLRSIGIETSDYFSED